MTMYRSITLLAAISLALVSAACAAPSQSQSSTDDTSAPTTSDAAPEAVKYPAINQPVEGLEPRHDDVALIVGVEEYAFLPNVAGARETAYDWEDFFRDSLNIGEVYTVLDEDANREDMSAYVEMARDEVPADGRLWFVFIGHGAPMPDEDDGLLVGMDARQSMSSLEARSFSRNALLDELTRGNDDVVVVLDTCFSGQTPDGDPLIEGAQPVVPALEASADHSSALVLSAAHGDQLAGPLPGAQRPSFSYLLLGALRGWATDEPGDVSAERAHRFVDRQLRHVTSRRQSPELTGPEDRVLVRNATESAPELRDLLAGRKTAPDPPEPSSDEPMIQATEGAVPQRQDDVTTTDPPSDATLIEELGHGLYVTLDNHWVQTELEQSIVDDNHWATFVGDRGERINIQWWGGKGRATHFDANVDTIIRSFVEDRGAELIGGENHLEIPPHTGHLRSLKIRPQAPAQLGASVNDMNAELAQTFDLDESFGGLVVVDILPGSAADLYGFQPGDIITSIDGKPVHTGEELQQAIQRRTAGTEATFHYIRHHQRGNRSVVLGEAADGASAGGQWMLLYATSSGRDLWIFGAVIPTEREPNLDAFIDEFIDLVSSARFVTP